MQVDALSLAKVLEFLHSGKRLPEFVIPAFRQQLILPFVEVRLCPQNLRRFTSDSPQKR